jgi:hypothetical protein
VPVGSNWFGDDHPTEALKRYESGQGHIQATAQMAANRGWFYRPTRRSVLVPDTRKCVCHGELHFDATGADDVWIPNPLSNEALGIS